MVNIDHIYSPQIFRDLGVAFRFMNSLLQKRSECSIKRLYVRRRSSAKLLRASWFFVVKRMKYNEMGLLNQFSMEKYLSPKNLICGFFGPHHLMLEGKVLNQPSLKKINTIRSCHSSKFTWFWLCFLGWLYFGHAIFRDGRGFLLG